LQQLQVLDKEVAIQWPTFYVLIRKKVGSLKPRLIHGCGFCLMALEKNLQNCKAKFTMESLGLRQGSVF